MINWDGMMTPYGKKISKTMKPFFCFSKKTSKQLLRALMFLFEKSSTTNTNTYTKSDSQNEEFYLFLDKSVCNANCIFCSRGQAEWQEKVRRELEGFDYQSELVTIEAKLRQTQQKSMFHLGGHEPSIYPTLIPIISVAASTGFKNIILETNGLALADENLVQKLVDNGVTEVRLPIYGVSEQVHDSITGIEGSLKKLKQAMENLEKTNITVRLKTVLLRQNMHEMEELLSLDRRMGCGLVMPSSQNPEKYRKLCPRLSSVKDSILDRIGDLYLPCIMPRRNFFSISSIPMAQRGQGFVSIEDSRIVRQGVGDNLSDEQRLQQKVFLRRCQVCDQKTYCTGIYDMYWQLYGTHELYPVLD